VSPNELAVEEFFLLLPQEPSHELSQDDSKKDPGFSIKKSSLRALKEETQGPQTDEMPERITLQSEPDEKALKENVLTLPEEKMPDGKKLAKIVKMKSFMLQGQMHL